jgi:uncharacterized protein with ParB-like and HNH nuclease domain
MDFQASDKKVSEVLFSGTQRFRIPRYQRPYSWGDDQLNEFWNDLKTEKETYFLGGFIFNYESEKENYIDVIDGQQRILTITIFVAVLRDVCKRLNKDRSEAIQRNAIAFEDSYSMTQTYRVEVGDSTKDYFEKYIQSNKNDIYQNFGNTKEEKRIYKAYEFFLEKISKEIESKNDKDSKIEWINTIRKKLDDLTVIRIKITSEEDAYEIFETTNARGVDLSVSDLLKNVILKHIKKEQKEKAKETWENITKNIENSNTELKKFIRYYWLSKHKFVTDKKLFKAIKNKTAGDEWQDLLIELEEDSNNWFKISEVNESDFADIKWGQEIYRSIKALRLMQVGQCNVFLLSVLRNIDKINTSPVLVIKFIESFTFQYSAICKLPGNKVEKLYSKYAAKVDQIVKNAHPNKISGKVNQCFDQMLNELKDLLPEKTYFLDNFAKLSYKKKGIPGYVLAKINENMQKTNEYLVDFNNVNIEHILPQKPAKWGLDQSQVKPYVHLIGNLTLLDESYNRTIGNEPLSVKLDHLRESQLEITKDFINRLSDDNTWSENEIRQRQTRFGELAYEVIWKI